MYYSLHFIDWWCYKWFNFKDPNAKHDEINNKMVIVVLCINLIKMITYEIYKIRNYNDLNNINDIKEGIQFTQAIVNEITSNLNNIKVFNN